MRRTCIGLGAIALIAACAGSTPAPSPASSSGPVSSSAPARTLSDEERSAHGKMRALLEEVRLRAIDEHPYLGDLRLRRLERARAAIQPDSPVQDVIELYKRLGFHRLKRGDNRGAVEALEQCLQRIEAEGQGATPLATEVRYDLAIAWLRLGETRNCVALHTTESCILPIGPGGVHEDQEGSLRAIGYLERVLAACAPEDPRAVASRWLLNVAYMTVGGYPDDVPADQRIDPSVFAPRTDFPRFVDVAPELGLNTFNLAGGVITEDFDQDGDLDVLTTTWDTGGPLRYFRNEGDGSFVDRTTAAGVDGFYGALSLVQADYDDDGHIDALLLRGAWGGKFGRHPNSLFHNNGDGTFTDVALAVGMTEHYPSQAAAWADYDRDGDLDVYIGNEGTQKQPDPSQLYRNRGDGTFEEVAEAAGVQNRGFTKGAAWGDVDTDGVPELYASNYGYPNRLYANRGDGTFEDVAEAAGVTDPRFSFATWFWDYDNDGALDLFAASYFVDAGYVQLAEVAASYLGLPTTATPPFVYRGDGTGRFRNVSAELGITEVSITMGANFGDLDNDGWLDLYLGTGYPAYDGLVPNVMYRSRGGQGFDNVTYGGGLGHLQKGHAIAFADLDNDGDQDVFAQMGGAYPGDGFGNAVFRNPGFGNRWIRIDLVGTESNRSAIGARLRLDLRGPNGRRSIHRQVITSGSFGASSLTQHVGLGDADAIERLEVRWPRTGGAQEWRDLPLDRHVRIVEGRDGWSEVPERVFSLGGTSPGSKDGS